MPDDEVAGQDDEDTGPEEVPTSVEEAADEAPGEGAVPLSDQDTAAGEPQGDEQTGKPSADEEVTAPAAGVPGQPAAAPEVAVEQVLARQRELDAQRNTETRPLDGERVTLRSVTLAELYVGRQADALAETLRETEWVDVDEQFADEIAKARQGDGYYNSQFLLMPRPAAHRMMSGYGKASLPDGVRRIVGQLYVLGPSMVTLALTFALTDSEAGRLDRALRDDAESQLSRPSPGRIGVKTVYQVKYERVQALQDEVGSRCLEWLRGWAPGTLGAGDGLGVPLCLLISLAQGKPFREPGDFMRLLDFASSFGVSSFAPPAYMFLVPRRGRKRPREFIAAFSEAEASAVYPDVAVAPEILHEVIFPFMVVLAMEGILASFESRMRGTRSGLANLDFGEGMEPQVADLRNRLLELSRDVAVVCGDIKNVIADNTAVSLWFDYPLLLPVDPARPSQSPSRQASDAPRKDLDEFIANVKGQETELRELVLVTSQVVSDAQNAKTQKTLNWLTVALVVLTVFVFVAALIPLFRSSPDDSSPSGTATASSPAPTHALHRAPSPSPSPSVSGKGKHS